jgi:vanillate O-demethylase monooxygenase subunit
MTDNLLDPSHVAWVHPSTFGSANTESTPVEVHANADGVTASRWIRDIDPAPIYVPFLKFQGACDRLQHYEVRFPSHAIIRAIFVPAGTGGKDLKNLDSALVMDSYNFMTPVDENQTRYFWFQMRNCFAGDESISISMDVGVRAAFEEDRVILAAIHEGLTNKVTKNFDLAIDRAPLLFRRHLVQLVQAEQSARVD